MNGDAGHEAVNALIRRIEDDVRKVYSQASKEAQAKLEAYFKGFQKRDAKKWKLFKAGTLSAAEYYEWRKNQILTGMRWQDMVAVLTEDMVNADKLAMSIVNEHTPEAYAINVNYGTYQIEHELGINTGFTLYDRHTVERLIRDKPDLLPRPKVDIPKDKRWNKQHINNSVTQAVLQGESMDKLAKRIFPEIMAKTDLKGKSEKEKKSIVKSNMRAAIRSARTAMTGAQNAGRIDAYKRAEDMGIEMRLEWMAAHDGRTRESHLDVDGEQVKVGDEFSNECRYPGDPGGPPEEVYNCRCTVKSVLAALGQIKGQEGYKQNEYQKAIEEYDKDKKAHKMSFEEWQKARGK